MSEEESGYSEQTELPLQIENLLLKGLKSSEQLLNQTVLEKLRTKIENITGPETIVHAVDDFLFSLINRLQELAQAITININTEDYQNLEAAAQKAESEIRHHIRLEQQLKIYMEGLEEKIEQLQRQLKCESQKYHQLFESTKALDFQKKQLKKKIKALEFKYKPNYDKNQMPKHLSHKGSKLLTEPSLHHEHSNSSAYKMYQDRNRLTRSKNFNSRSGDNSKHLNISNSKKKDLQSDINVYLRDSPKKKKSLQENNISKDVESASLTKTVHLKEVQRKKSRKLMNYESQLAAKKDKRQQRSSSVCN